MSSPVLEMIPPEATTSSFEASKPNYRNWYRRRRSARRQVADYSPPRENLVQGETHICLAPDKSWFQGSIITAQNHHYKVTGRRSDLAMDTAEVLETCDVGILPANNSTGSFSCTSSLSSGSTTPPFSGGKRLDSDSSLDSTLVEEAMEQLDLIDLGEEVSSFDAYNITVEDFETGLDYVADNVRLVKRGSRLILLSDAFKFQSHKCFKGAIADKVLNQIIGPSFVDRNLTVFKGEVKFVYADRQCRPVEVNATKWCL